MKLTRLITLNWGTLENREWELTDTLLLTGESGSGKSTLLDAIQTLLTAARAGIFQFNVGQDESTQTRRGGKEPRTLPAYALGQIADGVFIRSHSTSYIAAVFDASEQAAEFEQPFTALIGIQAVQEQSKATHERTRMFVVRRALNQDHFFQPAAQGQASTLVSVKDIYAHLQSQLRAGPEIIQCFEENKGRYLQHLFGAFMGKAYVPEADAFRAARAIVKAMAYKELGNVHDLVRDEILDVNDFSDGVTRLRDLMQTMARLKADAERLRLNIARLKSVDERCQGVLDVTRRFVIYTLAHALRARQEAHTALENVQHAIAELEGKNTTASGHKLRLQEEKVRINAQLAIIAAKLAESDVARERQALCFEATQLESRLRRDWGLLQTTARSLDTWITRVEQLLAMDLSAVPALLTATRPLIAPLARLVTVRSELREIMHHDAPFGGVLPTIEAAPLDADWAHMAAGVRAPEQSVATVIVQSLAEVQTRLGALKDEQAQLSAEVRVLQSGKPPPPPEIREALALLERELPQAEACVLAQLIEPKAGSRWQHAIEGYMARDRFAVIVKPDCERAAIRLLRERWSSRAAKIVQGAKAVEDTQGTTLRPDAVIRELECSHPIGRAYLSAQYGRVRKVASEEELRRTAQGLMERGLGSRGYGMFPCLMDENQLVFGEASRQRRMAWCETRLSSLRDELIFWEGISKSLKQLGSWFSDLSVDKLSPLIDSVADIRRLYDTNQQALAALDTSSIDALEDERRALNKRMDETQLEYETEIGKLAVQADQIRKHREEESALTDKLPTLDTEVANTATWLTRFASIAHGVANEPQLHEEAVQIVANETYSLHSIETRAESAASQLGSKLQEVRDGVDVYLSAVRTEDERFLYSDPPRKIERLEDVLRAILVLRQRVAEQLRRQEAIGLAQNLQTLAEAEARFNSVFTTGFCFKVRDDVRTGLTTLTKLNRELKTIQFGYDTYELEWDWVPSFRQYYDFFEAVDGVVETLEKDRVSIFDSPRLTQEYRQTAGHIRDLLLSEDQARSEKSLRELADYRNYRRYDIIRRNDSGATRLSTWGTGSGGELETPFYVIRAAVLAHALGHFGRDRQGAPALRLMLSDEAFAKMDESRSRSVLRFLSGHLHLQLIVAMPTSKSGAVKPEFSKEFTFSKVSATRDGKILYVSEAEEKWLKQAPMQELWARHAEAARQQGKANYQRNNNSPDTPQGDSR